MRLLEDVEHLEQDKALRGRRRCVDDQIPVGRGQRRAQLAVVSGEVRRGDQPAVRLRVVRDGIGERPLVEGPGSALGDRAQGAGQIGLHEDLADPGGAAVGEIDAGRRRIAREDRRDLALRRPREPRRHLLGDGKAGLRVVDRRFEQPAQREPAAAPLPEGGCHRVHGARDGRRQHPAERHGRKAALSEDLRRRRLRGRAAPVQPEDTLGCGVIVDDERVAPDPGHHRRDDPEHGGDADGGVDRIAAFFEHAEAGGRRQRVIRRHKAPLGQDRAPSLGCVCHARFIILIGGGMGRNGSRLGFVLEGRDVFRPPPILMPCARLPAFLRWHCSSCCFPSLLPPGRPVWSRPRRGRALLSSSPAG